MDLASFTPLPDLEATFLNDLWGWEDAHRMQLAIVGSFEGTAFVDVTDGENPVYLGTLESSAPGDSGNIWGDVRVYEDTAYIGSEALDFATYDPAAGSSTASGSRSSTSPSSAGGRRRARSSSRTASTT